MQKFVLLTFFLICISYTPQIKAQNTFDCYACIAGVTLVDILLQTNASETDLEKAIVPLCEKYSGFSTAVCEDIVPEFAPTVIPIFVGLGFNSKGICTKLGYCNFTEYERPSIKIPPKPDFLPTPKTGGTPLRILQLSDIHWDDMYTVGSNPDCPNPLCCRATDMNGKQKAGIWGAYTCDLSLPMFEAVMQQVSTLDPPVDIVVWTGDNPPHDVWNENATIQMRRIQEVSAKFAQYFPKTPVFPALGNHDTFPVDQFNREPIDQYHHDDFSWLMSGVVGSWGQWLDANAISTLGSGGYYTMLAQPGLRIIATNGQFGDSFNFYLLLDEDQQYTQLQWLADTLGQAEQDGEKVIILGHIPPFKAAPAVLSNWGKVYVSLVQRFSDIIVGQFYGHTHEDQFEMTMDGSTPVGVVYVSPAVTTFTYHNPSYRIYHYDANYTLVDHETWITNLTEANTNNKPSWYLEYTAKAAFNLPDLSPASWLNLINTFDKDDAVFQQWYRYFLSNPESTETCTGSCKSNFMCTFRSSTYDEYLQCTWAYKADSEPSRPSSRKVHIH